MARPTKAIVDYFPHNCNYGKTIPILQQKFGLTGYAVWFKLLEQLGKTENHYIDCRNDDIWLFLTSETMVEESLLQQILDLCARMNAIDKDLWKEKIIFSENFIEGIKDAYRNRKDKFITKESLLRKLSLDDVVSYEETPINYEEIPQSKVKEIKVNKNIPPLPPKENFEEKKELDIFHSKEVLDFLSEFKKITGLPNSVSTDERKKIAKIIEENTPGEITECFGKLKKIEFPDINFSPGINWLLKDNNFYRVINDEFAKKAVTNGSNKQNTRPKPEITLENSEFARIAREQRELRQKNN